MLKGQVAIVTGASRGIGRGIALQLGEAGATVYVTSRRPEHSQNHVLRRIMPEEDIPSLQKTADEVTARGGTGIAIYCDNGCPAEIEKAFKHIEHEQNGQIDILVNNAYSGVYRTFSNYGKPFFDIDPAPFWDEVNNAGLRGHYIWAAHVGRVMAKRNQGLVVFISSIGGLKYSFGVPYGVGKAACDRMAVDCAVEFKKHGVTCISLWPDACLTEMVKLKVVHEDLDMIDEVTGINMKDVFAAGESVEYAGKAVIHLAADSKRLAKTGRVWAACELGDMYGFRDIDGSMPLNLRSVKQLLETLKWDRLASVTPSFLRIPLWAITLYNAKF